MARVSFTPNLRRHLPCPSLEADGATIEDVLAAAFALHPKLRGYILDDQSRLRRHVSLYLNDRKAELATPVSGKDEIYVMQALSGG